MQTQTKEHAVDILNGGGIGVLPTDTLYGVVGSAFDADAVERIYTVKHRDKNKPCIVLIDSMDALAQFDVHIDAQQKEKLAEWWPGPYSIMLPCASEAYAYLHRGTHAIAFRMPGKDELRAFLSDTGPLIAPSANPEGEPPARTIAEACTYFGDQVGFYVDGGELIGEPSTLIDLTSDEPTVLRGSGK